MPSITNSATTSDCNAKTNEVKEKMPNIGNLATTTAFTAVENEMVDVSNFAKKTI